MLAPRGPPTGGGAAMAAGPQRRRPAGRRSRGGPRLSGSSFPSTWRAGLPRSPVPRDPVSRSCGWLEPSAGPRRFGRSQPVRRSRVGSVVDLETTVRLRVLGELAATRDGEVVDLGGRRQRAVLAALVILRDQVVPAERLAACVWGDNPPANPAGALQAYVSRGGTRTGRRDAHAGRGPPAVARSGIRRVPRRAMGRGRGLAALRAARRCPRATAGDATPAA